MPNKYVRKRVRELRAALKGQNIEALFWWIVREHETLCSMGRNHT